MNILKELLALSEAKGKNLLGLTIGKKKITEQTPSEPWPGNFDCYNNQLTSLEFCPKKVGGDFDCSYNIINSLKHGPETVGGDFNCTHIKLTTLEFCPKEVGKDFYCSNNEITSLAGAPAKIGGGFNTTNNITSLTSAPAKIGGGKNINESVYNNITSLKDIQKWLKKMNGTFYAHNNPIKSHVIGLLLIPGCKSVTLDNKEVEEILNKHLKSPFGHLRLLDCQEDLLSADFEEYAKL